jgi:aminoglycoside/choline kinase family phosphotransferase/choline kinase
MIDQRLDLLTDWLDVFFGDENFVITIASDDASFRRYFRIERDNASFIAMDAPPSKENCEPFIRIAKHLITGGVHAPKIIEANLDQGFLLLEDLGNQTFLNAQQKNFNIQHYKNAIDVLINIQSLETDSANIPSYDHALLTTEMQLLIDWYLPALSNEQHTQLQTIFDLLSDNALSTDQVFVHRDYHARNLMLVANNELGVIDFQDAVIGSNTYDLVSLLKDAYFELSPADLHTLLQYYYTQAKVNTPFRDFEKQFDLMGLQRHLKVLGIFKRLSVRDGKHQYLADIPLVAKYTLAVANKYPELELLSSIIELANQQTHAMILAAGRGERMMPLTKNTPKPLIKVKGIALIEHSINALKQAKITNIVINTSYLGEQLGAHLGDGSNFGVHITYSNESNGALETAGGIIKALPLLAPNINSLGGLGNKPFIVINSDVLCNYDLSKLTLPVGSLAHLILIDNPPHNPNGDFSLVNNHQVINAHGQTYTFSGIGIYHPDLFKSHLGVKQKLPLYPLLKEAVASGQLSGEHYNGYWQDVGTPERLKQANNS